MAEPALEPSSGNIVIDGVEVPNVGSARHHLRLCKPCAFVNLKGCRDGSDCRFCHLCETGEKKRRKKERAVMRRGCREWSGSSGAQDNLEDADLWQKRAMLST